MSNPDPLTLDDWNMAIQNARIAITLAHKSFEEIVAAFEYWLSHRGPQ